MRQITSDYCQSLHESELRSLALTVFLYDEAARLTIQTELMRRGLAFASVVPTDVRPRISRTAKYHVWILRRVRRARQLKRRLLGRYQWMSEIIGLLEFISLLDIVPTVSVILFEPEHLLWKTRQIVSRGSTLYIKPIRFVALCGGWATALMTVCRISGYGKWSVLLILAAASLLAPLWIPVFLLFANLVALPWIWAYRVKPVLFPGIFEADTYAYVRSPVLIWNLLYFGAFLFASAGSILAIIITLGMGLPVAALLVFVAHWLVFRPYMTLLIAVSSRPSSTMLFWLTRDLHETLMSVANAYAKGTSLDDTTVATMLSDWGRLRRTFRYQEEHVAGCGAKELERLLRDRATDLGSAFSLLAELLSYFAGSRVIDRLLEEVGRASNGLPISGKSQNAAAASAPR